jgi:hypothetical protein
VVRQCRKRIEAARALRNICVSADRRRRDYNLIHLGKIDTALQMAEAFLEDMRGEIEYGGSELGGSSGRGPAAVVREVKRAEGLIRLVVRLIDDPRESDVRPEGKDAETVRMFRTELEEAMILEALDDCR